MVSSTILDLSDYYICQIKNYLALKWYTVDGPMELLGKSGSSHDIGFFIVDSKNRTFAAPYILSGDFIDEEVILKMFGIRFDTGVDSVFLFVLPNLTRRAVKLANFYDFRVVDVSKLKNLSDNPN